MTGTNGDVWLLAVGLTFAFLLGTAMGVASGRSAADQRERDEQHRTIDVRCCSCTQAELGRCGR